MRSSCLALVLSASACVSAPAQPPTSTPAGAAVLPAGLYFRDGYLGRLASGYPLPSHAVIADIAPSPAQAALKLAALRQRGDLAPGYPMVVHTDELGMDGPGEGVVVVLALLSAEEAAQRWVAAHALKDTTIVPLLTAAQARERTSHQTRRVVVHVAPEAPASGHDPALLRAAEEAMWAGSGVDPLLSRPPTRCMIPPDALFVVDERALYQGDYRWVTVRCEDGRPATIAWQETLLNTLALPKAQGAYERVQVADVTCDTPAFRRVEVSVAGDVRPLAMTRASGCEE